MPGTPSKGQPIVFEGWIKHTMHGRKSESFVLKISLRKESLNIVINFTNINKTNNHPLILTELTDDKKTTTYDVGNPGPSLGQAHIWGGVKYVNGIPTDPS